MKQVAGTLRLDLAQFRELEAFAQFGSDLDEKTKTLIERGKRAVEVLKQPQASPLPVEKEVAVLYALTRGYLDEVAVEKVAPFEVDFISYLDGEGQEIITALQESKALNDDIEAMLKKHIEIVKVRLA
jgi:F-type H+-transporting ATPase subunit alpha